MGRTTKRRHVWVVATATATLLAGCGVLPGGSEPDPVLVGVDLALTGDGAELAAVYQNALRLRVEQVNEQGLLGDRELELVVRDNRSDGSTSATNVAELAGDPDVAAIITGGCNVCALASVSVANDSRVPMIALAAASEITEPVSERPWVFKVAPNAVDNAAVLGAELARRDVQTVAVVASRDPYGQEGAAVMADTAQRAGIEVVVNQELAGEDGVRAAAGQVASYQPEVEPDPVTGVVPEVADAGPDAVVVWAPPALTTAFASALREEDYAGPLYLDSIAADGLFLEESAAGALSGATMVFTESLVIDRVVATSPAKVARRNWFNTYTARYGTYHAFSVFAVDAVQLMVETVSRLDSIDRDATDRDELRSGFERLQIEGVSGPLRISPNNHSGLTSLGLITLVARGDRWQASR